MHTIHKGAFQDLLSPLGRFLAQISQLATPVSSKAAATTPAHKERGPFHTELDNGVPKVGLLHSGGDVSSSLTAFAFTSF